LLREYSGFVTSDMLENQYPVSSITPFLRFSSFYLSSTSTNSSSSPSLSIPETSFENYFKSLGQSSSSQQSIEFSSGILYPLQLSISETLFEATTIEKVNATENVTVFENQTQLTPPLVVTLQSSPCSSNGKEEQETNPHCLMKVVLQNKIKNSNPPDQAISVSSTSSSYFDVACVKGVAEELSYVCPSGQVLTASCNGSVAMKGRRYCSERSSEVECRTTVQLSSTTSHSQDICQLSEYNESVTICLCDLSQVGVVGEDSSVSFSIMSIQKSVTRDFVSTWETLPDLSSGDVAGSWVVLVTVGGVGVAFLVMIMIGIQSDRKERHSVSTDVGSRRNMQPRASLFSSGITPSDPSQTESEVHEDVKMIEDALPSIFKSNSLWNKFKEEMKVYHRWLGIVFYYSPEFPRAMRVLSLFSSIVIMLFVQSVTYNIADPDDGSCENCEDESCCLSLKSTLNSNEDRCYWEVSSTSTDQGSCHFRQISDDLSRVFIVAMISAIVSAPFALSIQYLVVNVLSQETMTPEEVKRETQLSKWKSLQKLLSTRNLSVDPESPLTDLVVEKCGSSVSEDLENLLKDISGHYKRLLKANKPIEEFRGE
jgi:hypothetical protein